MFNWEEKRKSVEEGDCVIIAQTDEEGRAEAITTAKPLYQIDSMIPGAKCYYCAQSLFDQHTTLQNFRCTMRIDFPPDVDIEKE